MTDRHHQAPFCVVNAAPVWLKSVGFPGAATPDVLSAWHLKAVVEIGNDMKNRIAVRNIFDRAMRENALHCRKEDGPRLGSVEVVAHKEAAAVEELAHLLYLTVCKLPVAYLNGVEPGIVEDIVTVIEIHRLFHRANVHARE